MAASASAMVYTGSYSSPPLRRAFRFLHWASNSWMWALSRSMMLHRSEVAKVVTTSPENPCLHRSGMFPEWSMWAWVRST